MAETVLSSKNRFSTRTYILFLVRMWGLMNDGFNINFGLWFWTDGLCSGSNRAYQLGIPRFNPARWKGFGVKFIVTKGTTKWWTTETITILHEKIKASNKMVFRELCKKAHKLARRDENAYWSKLTTDLEEATALSREMSKIMMAWRHILRMKDDR